MLEHDEKLEKSLHVLVETARLEIELIPYSKVVSTARSRADKEQTGESRYVF